MKYNKISFIFPGQGSQYIGMGNEFLEGFDIARDIIDEASRVLGYDVAHLILKKPRFGKIRHKADLNKTVYTQPAVLITSYLCFKVFETFCKEVKVHLEPAFLAGHSLGEYTALLAAGTMDFKTTLDLVKKRATYITEFSKTYPDAGLMAIVNRGSELDSNRVDSLCGEFQVYKSIINTPKQIVVGGFRKNLTSLAKQLKKENMHGVPLNVEGPFHTPLMQPAADKFKKALDKCNIQIASKPVIANVSSEAIVDPEHIRKELYLQIFSNVDWRRSVEKIVANGGDLFIELGPKTILSKMVKDIAPSAKTLNVENMETLKQTVKELAEIEGDL
ncbi:MAG: ACP S-malonyltransferase [Deltaproteobacteria bacterium]|nr:ACP S-malonyltransferase [Deltaproteobacteria bacterium]